MAEALCAPATCRRSGCTSTRASRRRPPHICRCTTLRLRAVLLRALRTCGGDAGGSGSHRAWRLERACAPPTAAARRTVRSLAARDTGVGRHRVRGVPITRPGRPRSRTFSTSPIAQTATRDAVGDVLDGGLRACRGIGGGGHRTRSADLCGRREAVAGPIARRDCKRCQRSAVALRRRAPAAGSGRADPVRRGAARRDRLPLDRRIDAAILPTCRAVAARRRSVGGGSPAIAARASLPAPPPSRLGRPARRQSGRRHRFATTSTAPRGRRSRS